LLCDWLALPFSVIFIDFQAPVILENGKLTGLPGNINSLLTKSGVYFFGK
jgi:hypothetical protein